MPIVTQPRRGDARHVTAVRRQKVSIASLSPEAWMVVGLTVVAGLLRFSTLTSQSFWLDEATTVHEVGLSLGGMLHAIRLNETTPPLYFLVAWVWTRLFGAGEFGLRSLSALAGTALIPVSYLCGRALVSRRAGLVAAALATFSPFLIWYSQEARSYMLFGLLSALSLLFWARTLRGGSRVDLIAWAAFSVLAVLTHFFAGFLIAPEALWLLWIRRDRDVLLAVALVAGAQLAVVPILISDASHPLSWILAFPLSVRIEQIPADLGASQLYKSAGVTWGLPGAAILLGVVIGLLILGGSRVERLGAARAGALAAFVLLVPVGLAELGHDYVFSRNFMAAWVPLSVVIGAACTGRRVRFPGALVVLALVAGFVWASVKIDGDPAYQRPDWRGVAAALGQPVSERAIVALSGNAAEQPLSVYLPRTQFSYSGLPASETPVSVSEIDVVGEPLETATPRLPRGVHLLGVRTLGGSLVARFRLATPWHLSPIAIAQQASLLVTPRPAEGPAILIQPPPPRG
jgi:4-amino-4-deoxy-L-arabinose transferase-like glycosyltransferase